jgi:excisionase family DNA binding protein
MDKSDMHPWQLLSLNEGARMLNLCRRSLEIRIARGEIPSVKIGRRRLLRLRDLLDYVKAKLE